MTGLLITVGIFVFMLTVYGAVMIGGHLLGELEGRTAGVSDAPEDRDVPESRTLAA